MRSLNLSEKRARKNSQGGLPVGSPSQARDAFGPYVASLPWEEGFLGTTEGDQVAAVAGFARRGLFW